MYAVNPSPQGGGDPTPYWPNPIAEVGHIRAPVRIASDFFDVRAHAADALEEDCTYTSLHHKHSHTNLKCAIDCEALTPPPSCRIHACTTV